MISVIYNILGTENDGRKAAKMVIKNCPLEKSAFRRHQNLALIFLKPLALATFVLVAVGVTVTVTVTTLPSSLSQSEEMDDVLEAIEAEVVLEAFDFEAEAEAEVDVPLLEETVEIPGLVTRVLS